jgi:hypothetical protein
MGFSHATLDERNRVNHGISMRVTQKAYLVVCCFMVGQLNAEELYNSARYQLILDREPFGHEQIELENQFTPAQEAAAAKAEVKAAERELRLCFIFETNQGEIRAGFQNKLAKPGDPKSIMLGIGESFRGMRLVSVDLEESTATLDRSGIRVTFSLTKAAEVAPVNPVAKPAPRRFGTGFRAQSQPEKKPEEPKLSAEEQAMRRAEIQENLRQYQMEVIRKGMPPLPIPLTQEMDDQLVTEGILPPL